MIRVKRGAEIGRKGIYRYAVSIHGSLVEGVSREPLLDACRKIKSILGPTSQRVGLFREGRDEPDVTCDLNWGAGRTVRESPSLCFAAFKSFTPWVKDDCRADQVDMMG
jgi:hypothetical protein